ncbi:hypothetical protein ABIC78_004244 [Novosphingobium sp. 1529]|uniref:O-antigen ligase family protein n=1 Tax=Novosphingobium sp. 1529 TaxID=3156424 RepID=UPI00339B77CF
MAQFDTLLQIMLFCFCFSMMTLILRPIWATMYLIWFRATFAVAAYLHISSLAGMPFFVPAYLALWIVIGIHYIVMQRAWPPALPIFSYYIVTIFMLISTLGFFIFSPSPPSNLIDTMTKHLLPIAVYFGISAGIRNATDLQRLATPLIWTLIAALLVGLIQSLTGYSYDYAHDLIVTGIRPVGTIIDANAYGIFLCLCAFTITPYAMMPGQKQMKLLLALFILAILLSKNRGSWIAAIIAVIIGVMVYSRHINLKRFFGMLLVVTLVGSPIVVQRFTALKEVDKFGQSQDTFSERINQSSKLLGQASLSPIVGYGAGSAEQPWGNDKLSRPPHDDYVRMVYEFGYPIAVLYIIFLFDQAIRATRLKRSQNWQYGFGALMAMVYVIVISFTQNLLFDTITYAIIMLILAITHRAIRISHVQQKNDRDSEYSTDDRPGNPSHGNFRTANRVIR